VDPTNDTPPVLLAYAQRFHAQPGWTFLTGPVADVRRVVVDGFKQAMDTQAVGPGEPDRVIHGDRFVVVDKVGHMRGFPEAQSPELGALLERLR
jgi:cytochrome oxidase Cu insertion factor (SCO1/SenC/PrrC family)